MWMYLIWLIGSTKFEDNDGRFYKQLKDTTNQITGKYNIVQ